MALNTDTAIHSSRCSCICICCMQTYFLSVDSLCCYGKKLHVQMCVIPDCRRFGRLGLSSRRGGRTSGHKPGEAGTINNRTAAEDSWSPQVDRDLSRTSSLRQVAFLFCGVNHGLPGRRAKDQEACNQFKLKLPVSALYLGGLACHSPGCRQSGRPESRTAPHLK